MKTAQRARPPKIARLPKWMRRLRASSRGRTYALWFAMAWVAIIMGLWLLNEWIS